MNAPTSRADARDADLVSIVIPVFNGSLYVGEAIESALAQSWPAIEVVVVDDGSDDGGATLRVLASFGDAIRVLSKPNGGVATALNAGIAAMRGRWFSWLSHDDLYHPLKIERFMAALQADRDANGGGGGARPGTSIAFGDIDLVDEQGRFIHRIAHTRGYAPDSDARWTVLEGRINGCAMLIPRGCLTESAFDPGLPTTQDYALWFTLAGRHRFVPVPEALVRSRVHAEQGSRHARHVEEASLLWVRMLEDMDAEAPRATALDRLQRLRRVQGFLRRAAYPGALGFVDARIDALLADVPVALTAPDGDDASGLEAMKHLAAAGGNCSGVLLIDDARDAAATLRHARTPWPADTQVLLQGGQAMLPSELLKAAFERSNAPVMAFIASSSPPAPEVLREGLAAVAAGEIDGWLDGDAASPPGLLGALAGSVFSRRAVAWAIAQGGSPLDNMTRDARLTQAAPPRIAAAAAALPGRVQAVARRAAEDDVATLLARPPLARLPTLLILVHDWGGGTIRYAQSVGAAIAGRANVLYGWGVENSRFRLASSTPDSPEVEYDLAGQFERLIDDLRRLDVGRVDVMHSIGFDDHLDDFLDRLGVPFDLTFVDYHQVSTQPHLVDAQGHFVGDDALAAGLPHALLRPGPLPLCVRRAERLIACSRDLAARLQRLAGVAAIPVLLPEPGPPHRFALHAPPLADGETMRVLYLGLVAANKGAALLEEVAELAARRALPLRIDCLGGIAPSMRLSMTLRLNTHLRFLGSYSHHELNALVCRLRPHLAWLPFTAPETHSFSLSDVMSQGLPILATGIGAIPERVHGRPATWLLRPEEADAETVVHWLERLHRERLAPAPRWLPVDHLPPAAARFYETDYLRPLFSA